MQVPFVGFQPIRTSEHMAAAGKPKFDFFLYFFYHTTKYSRKQSQTLLN